MRTFTGVPPTSCGINPRIRISSPIQRAFSGDGMRNWYHGEWCAAPPGLHDGHGAIRSCDDLMTRRLHQPSGGLSVADGQTPHYSLLLPSDGRALGPRSLRRLSWPARRTRRRLPAQADDERARWPVTPSPDGPSVNSVELVTAANVVCVTKGNAVAPYEVQQATALLVNRPARHAATSLAGQTLRFAAPYYPWVPFKLLAFLAHDHCSGNAAPRVRHNHLIGEAPQNPWRGVCFSHWLNCAMVRIGRRPA